MKKKVLCLSMAILCSVPSFAAAQENNDVQDTELLEYEGEEFELETRVDDSGTEYYTISTEVENKAEIAQYVDDLVEDKQNVEVANFPDLKQSIKSNSGNQSFNESINSETSDAGTAGVAGPKIAWSRSLSNTDSYGKIEWSVTGYSQGGTLYPIGSNKLRVNDGNVKVTYTGSGVADKIVSSYKYSFNGTTVGISFPPSLTRSSSTVSWKSSPVVKQWYVSHKTHWAEGSSRTYLGSVELTASGDVYKGSNIYRPRVTNTVKYLSK